MFLFARVVAANVPTLGEVGDIENVFVKQYKSSKIAGFLNLKI